MKALTLHQPWAHLVAIGAKRWETRSWKTNYRGPIAIHAGRDLRTVEQVLENEYSSYRLPNIRRPFDRYLQADWAWLYGSLNCGGVVAIADLVACYPADQVANRIRYYARHTQDPAVITWAEEELAFGDFSPGRWAWSLNVYADTSDSGVGVVRGYQGLWTLPADHEFHLRAACASIGVYPTTTRKLLEAA